MFFFSTLTTSASQVAGHASYGASLTAVVVSVTAVGCGRGGWRVSLPSNAYFSDIFWTRQPLCFLVLGSVLGLGMHSSHLLPKRCCMLPIVW